MREYEAHTVTPLLQKAGVFKEFKLRRAEYTAAGYSKNCLLYTSDAADE